jgi:hypothetical protein
MATKDQRKETRDERKEKKWAILQHFDVAQYRQAQDFIENWRGGMYNLKAGM